MPTPVTKKYSDSHYGHASLGLMESAVSWCFWIIFAFYPVYLSFQVSKKFEDYLVEGCLEKGWFLIKRDVTDYEWTDFRDKSLFMTPIILLHSVSGTIFTTKFPKSKNIYYSIAGAFLVLIIMSYEGFLFICIVILTFCFLIQFCNNRVMWLFILIFLVCFHWDIYREYLFSSFGIKSTYSSIVHVSTLMTVLRLISYGTEKSNGSLSFSIFDLLSYLFYLPLFFHGPVLTFDLFIKDFSQPKTRSNLHLIKDFLQCVIIGFIIDLYYHYSFVNALSTHHHILGTLNEIEAIAVGWPLIVLFCIKYKVFYGLTGVFTMIDGIESPASPKCVCTLYTFVDMWRYFDQGLYRLLQRSIYIQIGGSHQGYMKTLIASFSCFGFVALWHGNNKQYWYWGLLNWLGICVEHCIAKIMKGEKGKQFKNIIGLANYRRIIGLSGSVAILSLIYSNLVFVTSIESANLIYQQIMSQLYSSIIVFITFYFSTNVSIDLRYIT